MKKIINLFALLVATSSFATANPDALSIAKQPGFFRFSYDNLKMPSGMDHMGLLGLNYLANITPTIYAGVGGYGAVTGTQGGLFTLGITGGLQHEIFPHIAGDVGLFVGGGGGRSSLVGGGLMLRPHIGLKYNFSWASVGVHYSYITFPDGEIHSSQVGVDFEIPYDFYYVPYRVATNNVFNINDIQGLYHFLEFQRNDFGILVQRYQPPAGTKNVLGNLQDGAMGLVGAELDHYLSQNIFWSIKASGAFSGSTNGYMDVLGGLGYHFPLGIKGVALVPKIGLGVGGGGNVDTGGGVLILPELGLEWPLTTTLSGRLSGGYLWAPDGQLKAATVTGEILYHLDLVKPTESATTNLVNTFWLQPWRIQLFNQTYLRPQRAAVSTRSPDNLIVLQLDQLWTEHFFFTYQAASAYSGYHAGGYATGMIGPGLQTSPFFRQHMQLFGEVLVGAGGGGGLALGGGALIEPVLGLHYALTNAFGLQASVSQVKALHNNLNTPVVNLGFTVRFDTMNRVG